MGDRLPAKNDAPAKARESIREGLLLHAADFVPNFVPVRFLEEQATDDQRNASHDHRIVEPRVNIMRALANVHTDERHQAAKHAVTDVIWQGQRGVPYLRTESVH